MRVHRTEVVPVAIDDLLVFRSRIATVVRQIEALMPEAAIGGLTPKKYQSGETDVTGRISKIGDASVRTALYEAANVILTRPVKGSCLKSWAMRVAKRAGMRKAKVGLWRASLLSSSTACCDAG